MFKKFMVYLDDGDLVYKVAIPAKSEKDARSYAEGNGEIIAVKEVTEDFPISSAKVADALKHASFGKIEIDLIVRALSFTNITD